MTMEQRIRAVESFGYTKAEARFLCLVALHGGYFVRRQFLYSAGCELGKRAEDFIDKLTARKHACREVYREDRHLFRLHYKPIYAAIGEEDNRNRREHQPTTIRLRLMGLDFVLEHPEHQFLATQQDKLRYFFETRKIEAELLPSRAYSVNDSLSFAISWTVSRCSKALTNPRPSRLPTLMMGSSPRQPFARTLGNIIACFRRWGQRP